MDAGNRNAAFDTLKGVTCLLIVCMHCEFPGTFGRILQAVSRFSVPFFFMVSGYFCYSVNDRKVSIERKIARIAKITMAATLFYLIVSGLSYIGGLTGYFYEISAESIIHWLVFNQPVIIASQMWFLFALLYTYVAVFILHNIGILKNGGCVLPVLLLCGYWFLTQGRMSLGLPRLANCIYRNWLFEGLPYFLIGYYLHKNEEKIWVSNTALISMVALATICVIPECYFLGRDFGVNLCSVPQALALFVFGMKNKSWNVRTLNLLGKRYSMYVYVLHPFVWHLLQNIYVWFKMDESLVAGYLMPIVVMSISTLLSIGVYRINEGIKQRQKTIEGMNR